MHKTIQGLDDFRLTLAEMKSIIDDLIDEHGESAIIYTDAGHNNVSIRLEAINPGKTKTAYIALVDLAEQTQQKANEIRSDWGQQGMYLSDAGDYLHIASLLKDGHLDRAAERAFRLDTAARDMIPESVWNYLIEISKSKSP